MAIMTFMVKKAAQRTIKLEGKSWSRYCNRRTERGQPLQVRNTCWWTFQLRQKCSSDIQGIIVVFVVQLLSCVPLFATPWAATYQPSLSFTISWSLFKLVSIESVMLSNHLIFYCPLLLLSVFPGIRVFSNESALHIKWPKYWSFNLSISPSNEYSGLISFRIDWFDLLAVQGSLKSLIQYHSSKALILRCSAFFMI